MTTKKVLEIIEQYINDSWFYDNEEPDFKVLNVDALLEFIKSLKNKKV